MFVKKVIDVNKQICFIQSEVAAIFKSKTCVIQHEI